MTNTFPQTTARSLRSPAALATKRCIDLILTVGLVVAFAPLMLAIVVAILVRDGRPVFFRWEVLGKDARPFTGFKFRTMVRDAEALRHLLDAQNEMTGPVFKIRNDPRITPTGRFLRRTSLDELPQLWSVLKGDMSLVGPRPMYPAEYASATPSQQRKLSVTPGITCLWQVEGRGEIRDFDRWVALDLEYIESWSLLLDLKILCRTLPAVLRRRGAW